MTAKKGPDHFVSTAIDFSGGYIRLAEVTDAETGVRLENFRVVQIPLASDETEKARNILKALKEVLGSLPDQKRKFFSVIYGSDVVIRRLLLPKLKDKALLEALRWELKSHIPFPVEKAVIDYYLLGTVHEKGAEKLDLLAVAVPKESIGSICSIFSQAGIKLDGISVTPFAVWDLVRRSGALEKEKTTAFVDIGAETTRIVFFSGENLEFYREVSLGGDNFTKALVGLFVSDKWQMNFSFEQAEKAKDLYGIPAEGTGEITPEGVPLFQILQLFKPVLRRFMNEIVRSFSYYKEQFRHDSIDKVVISGGTSNMKGLDVFMSAALECNVSKFTFTESVAIEKGAGVADEGRLNEILPHLSVAIGTALSRARELDLLKRSGSCERAGIDLSSLLENTPLARLTAFKVSLPKRTFAPVVLSFLLLFIAVIIGVNVLINNSLAHYKNIIRDRELLLNNVKSLSDKQSVLAKIESEQPPLREAMAELTNILPPDAYLDSFSYTTASKVFSVAGHCTYMSSVGKAVEKIERSPYFEKTVLLEAKRDLAKSGINFKLNFNLSI